MTPSPHSNSHGVWADLGPHLHSPAPALQEVTAAEGLRPRATLSGPGQRVSPRKGHLDRAPPPASALQISGSGEPLRQVWLAGVHRAPAVFEDEPQIVRLLN